MKNTLAVILGGGEGSRLYLLTKLRAKPAVPFGANYRIADFSLSNCLNSGIKRICVPTQYESVSLSNHLERWARGKFSVDLGEFLRELSIKGERGEQEVRYKGTADAVYRNLRHFRTNYDEMLILSGDHIYNCNYTEFLDEHRRKNADLSILVTEVPDDERSGFGILEANGGNKVIGFEEKPAEPKSNLASMGIYLFNREFLEEVLRKDAEDTSSNHDFGRNIIPMLIRENAKVYSHKFSGFWKDVGTIKAFYESNMDLVSVKPKLNLYDLEHKVYNDGSSLPPSKINFDLLIGDGSIVVDANIHQSILGPGTTIGPGHDISRTIFFGSDTDLGKLCSVDSGCMITRAIIDKNVRIGKGCVIGHGGKPNYSEKGLVQGQDFDVYDGITVVAKDVNIPDGTVL